MLSAGAAPAMVDNPEEAADFARIAGAVLINLGTPNTAQVEGMRLAVAAAHDAGRPWVLDPIGAGGLAWRGSVAAQLLAFKPAVIRGNAEVDQHRPGDARKIGGFFRVVDHGWRRPGAEQHIGHKVGRHHIGQALHQRRIGPQRRVRGDHRLNSRGSKGRGVIAHKHLR